MYSVINLVLDKELVVGAVRGILLNKLKISAYCTGIYRTINDADEKRGKVNSFKCNILK